MASVVECGSNCSSWYINLSRIRCIVYYVIPIPHSWVSLATEGQRVSQEGILERATISHSHKERSGQIPIALACIIVQCEHQIFVVSPI